MKIGLTIWNNKLSPVYDSAESILIVEPVAGESDKFMELRFPVQGLTSRGAYLVQLGIKILICGAISTEAKNDLLANGIEVFSYITGAINDVLPAWKQNRLGETCYIMAGCKCRHNRCRKNRRDNFL